MQPAGNSGFLFGTVAFYPPNQGPRPSLFSTAERTRHNRISENISSFFHGNQKASKVGCKILCTLSSLIAASHLPTLIKQAKLLSPVQPRALRLLAITFSDTCFWSAIALIGWRQLTTLIPSQDCLLKLNKEAATLAESVKQLSVSSPHPHTLLKYRREAQTLCQKVCQLISQSEHQLIVNEQLRNLSKYINEEVLCEINLRTVVLYDQNNGTNLLPDYETDSNFITRLCNDGLRLSDYQAVADSVWGNQEAYPFIAIDLAAKDIFTFEEFKSIKLTRPDGTVIPYEITYQRQPDGNRVSIDTRKEKLEHILKGKVTFNFSKNASPSISLLKLCSPERHLKMRCVATAIKISVVAFYFFNTITLRGSRVFSIPLLISTELAVFGLRLLDTRPQAFARASKLGKLQWLLTSLSFSFLEGDRLGKIFVGTCALLRDFIAFMLNTSVQRALSIYEPLAPRSTTVVNILMRLAVAVTAALDLFLTLSVALACASIAIIPVIFITWIRALIDEIFGIYIGVNNFSFQRPLLFVEFQ